MEDNLFKLSDEQLVKTAQALEKKIQEGLTKEKQEVLCMPTYINPKTIEGNQKALVLDLGGTNFRVAIVEFVDGKPIIHPQDGLKKKLDKLMKKPATEACTRDQLYKAIADIVENLDLKGIKHIGYCFSYPCANTEDGDAILLKWTKGVTVTGMVGKDVGNSLMKYLNEHIKDAEFTSIKVINDTVAALFAGLTDTEAQAHIGLIVGTGTNMATFFPGEAITKEKNKKTGLIPVNLESGNFKPPYLTIIDEKIDRYSDSRGAQRFEKAISGMYLGRILEYLFSNDEIEDNFDASGLTRIMSYPDMYKEKYATAAYMIYQRSAKLVAASLAGMILQQKATYAEPISRIRLIADGSLFWSKDWKANCCRQFTSYKDVVMTELHALLKQMKIDGVEVVVEEMENPNLIGSAIAALS